MTEPHKATEGTETSPRPLSLPDLAPLATGGALAFIGPLLDHASIRAIVAGLVAGAAFFVLGLGSLRYLSHHLASGVLGGALAGSVAGFIYWVLGTPDVTAVGSAGLGLIGGAVVSVFQLIFLQYKRQVVRIEDDHDAVIRKMDDALSRRLSGSDTQTGQ